MTSERVLALPMGENEAGVGTVREYLITLLAKVWHEAEGFSGKRPFGNSDWQWELLEPLAKAGMIAATFDEDGYFEECDDDQREHGESLIADAIQALGDIAPSTLKTREGDQVLPTPNGHATVHAQAAADLMERERVGVKRYGAPLQPFNGRDSLRDLYEELLDAAAYAKQRMIEEATPLAASGTFATFMDAWRWVRDLSGCTEATPIDRARIVYALAHAKANSPEERTKLAVAERILREGGALR